MEDAAAAVGDARVRVLNSPTPRDARVRVVARICPGGESKGSFRVAAHVSDAADSSASISFIPINKETIPAASTGVQTPRKDCKYKLDYCYLKDDSYTRIFDNEVKHHLDNIFCGDEHRNASIITCGATAKTHLLMGSQGHPGILTMTIEQILHRANEIGAAISVSSYQVLEDSVFDLLEPKDSEVRVLQDADGKTHLKGLSRVDIKSMEEFSDLCCGTSYKLKHATKTSNQIQARGDQGFVVYISRECTLAKINFLDLAGYVDIKQKGLGPSYYNKSMCAIMDVIHALNSNRSFISYRAHKVARILQDSLCKTSGAVLICCLDEVSCQDAVSTITWASRSSQVVNERVYNLTLGSRRFSKSNAFQSASTKKMSVSSLPAIIQQQSSQKRSRILTINSADKVTRTPTATKRSEVTMHSAKRPVNSVSSLNMKRSGVKSIQSVRSFFTPNSNSTKQPHVHFSLIIGEHIYTGDFCFIRQEVQSSLGMEIQASSPVEACDEIEKVVDVVSYQMQEIVPCSIKELASVDMQEKDPQDHSSSDLHAENSFTDLGLTCSSDICAHLKFRHAEDLQESLMGRSTGIKKSLAQECLTVLNSANKEQLRSLKGIGEKRANLILELREESPEPFKNGIGEKRANLILELREESPEPFKNIDDLKTLVGMNKKEVSSLYLCFLISLFYIYDFIIQL
nr:unnamed protein product [Digitaria exilis]